MIQLYPLLNAHWLLTVYNRYGALLSLNIAETFFFIKLNLIFGIK